MGKTCCHEAVRAFKLKRPTGLVWPQDKAIVAWGAPISKVLDHDQIIRHAGIAPEHDFVLRVRSLDETLSVAKLQVLGQWQPQSLNTRYVVCKTNAGSFSFRPSFFKKRKCAATAARMVGYDIYLTPNSRQVFSTILLMAG